MPRLRELTAELEAGPDLVIPSFSSKTVVYKGMLTALQLEHFYPDLADPRYTSGRPSQAAQPPGQPGPDAPSPRPGTAAEGLPARES